MKVTIVCEHNPSMDGEEGKSAYPEGMGNCIAGFKKKAGYEVTLVTYDDKGIDGLTDEILENTEVMFWWGHWYHGAVPDALADRIVYRAQRGMGMVFLHSAHVSKPFKKLTGGTGSLKWREDAEHERLWCVAPAHPIAAGLGEYIDVPQEEMYGEPFDIPEPDELVYIGWFRGGEVLRGGCVFKRGRGKFFYFNPGHETYPTYKIPQVQQLLVQACKYVAPAEIIENFDCPNIPEYSLKF